METKFKVSNTSYEKLKQQLGPKLKNAYNKPYTATIFSFLAVALFAWYAIKPTIQTILFLKREIADKQTVSQKMEDKISALITGQANLDAASNQLPLIDQALPSSPDTLSVTSQIKNLADLTGASIAGLQISSVPLYLATSSANLTNLKQISIPISISLSGTYNNIHDFISGIIDMRRIVTIDSYNISQDVISVTQTANTIGGPVPLRMTVKLDSYYVGK